MADDLATPEAVPLVPGTDGAPDDETVDIKTAGPRVTHIETTDDDRNIAHVQTHDGKTVQVPVHMLPGIDPSLAAQAHQMMDDDQLDNELREGAKNASGLTGMSGLQPIGPTDVTNPGPVPGLPPMTAVPTPPVAGAPVVQPPTGAAPVGQVPTPPTSAMASAPRVGGSPVSYESLAGGIDTGLGVEEKGMEQQVNALNQNAAEMAKVTGPAAWEQQGIYDQQKDNIEEAKQKSNAMLDKAQAVTDHYLNAKIDPNEWWNSRDTGQKVMAGLALAFGAIGAGATGKNQGAEAINQAVNEDIQRQKDAIERGEKGAGILREMSEAYMKNGLNANQALQAAQATLKDKVDTQLKQIAANSAGPEKAGELLQGFGGKIVDATKDKAGVANSVSEMNLRAVQAAKERRQMQIEGGIGLQERQLGLQQKKYEFDREVGQNAAMDQMFGGQVPKGASIVQDPYSGERDLALNDKAAEGYNTDMKVPTELKLAAENLAKLRQQHLGVAWGNLLPGDRAAVESATERFYAATAAGSREMGLTSRTNGVAKEYQGNPMGVFGMSNSKLQEVINEADQKRAATQNQYLLKKGNTGFAPTPHKAPGKK